MDSLQRNTSPPASQWLRKVLGVVYLLPFVVFSSAALADGISIGIGGGDGGGSISIDPIETPPPSGDFSIDRSFMSTELQLYLASLIQVNAALVQPDGTIVVAGSSLTLLPVPDPKPQPFIMRYTSSGDRRRYESGAYQIYLPVQNASITAISTEQDDSLVVVGNSTSGGFISRIFPDGTRDGSLGDEGILFNDFGFRKVLFNAVVVRPNGKLVIAGCAESLDASTHPVVIQLLADGTADTSFSLDGIASIDTDADACTTTMLVQPDAAVLLAGDMSGSDPQQGFVARLLENGNTDTSFSVNGVRYIAASPAAVSIADIAARPDGRIVAIGSLIEGNEQSIMLSGIMADGTLDETIGGYTGYEKIDAVNGRTRAMGRSVLLQPDGDIVIVGDQDSGEGTRREAIVGRPYGDAIGYGTYFLDSGEEPEDIRHLEAASAVVLPDANLILASTLRSSDSSLQSVIKIRLRDTNGDGDTEAWDVTPSAMSATKFESQGTISSSVITIGGLENGVSVPFVVTGAEYTLNAPSNFRSGYAWLTNGDQIQLRYEKNAESSVRLAVGGTQSDSSPAALLTDDVVRRVELSDQGNNDGGVPSVMLLWLLACLGVSRRIRISSHC